MDPNHENKFRATVEDAIATFGISGLSTSQLDQLDKHFSMMCRWNRHINLTRIIEPGQAARLHYAESLWGGRFIDNARTILDIGSGAGFPGIPLAVMRNDVQVTAVEANQKKALFLNEVKDALGLMNFHVVNARVEDFDWTGHDLLTCRALDNGDNILASVVRRLRPPQRLMLYCGPALADVLSGHLAKRYEVELHPIPQSEARIIALLSSVD